MAKPDNRQDNAIHLQQAKSNTIENLEESEQYLDEHADEIAPQELNSLKKKNKNRRESIQFFQEEIEDESN